jgi:uncharacterized membrane protein
MILGKRMINIYRWRIDIMKYKKLLWPLIIISIIGTIAILPTLPEQIPIHWNAKGEIDGYGPKYSSLILACVPALIYLLMTYMPKIDPKKENYKKHSKAYSIITASTVIIFIVLHWITILAALNLINRVDFFVKLLVAILFVILGNYMTQLRFNYFTGIKLPWTLASETVWKKTHRVGGIGFMIIGIIYIISSFISGSLSFIITMVSLFILMSFTTIYSYIEYQKEINNK